MDLAIETALTIRRVFHLPLRQIVRQIEGFLRSLVDFLELGLSVLDHTALSRPFERLESLRFRRLVTVKPIHLLIDSMGLGVHVGHLRTSPTRGFVA